MPPTGYKKYTGMSSYSRTPSAMRRVRNRRQKYSRTAISKSIDWKMVPKGKQVHHHVRWATTDSTILLHSLASGEQSDAFTFSLNKLSSFVDLSALYDQYKITKIVGYVNWSPLSVPANYINDNYTTPELLAPLLMFHADYDDANVETVAQMKERSQIKQIRLQAGKQYKIVLTPAVLQEIYRSGVSSSYAPKFHQKLDMANVDVPHYGIKTAVSYLPSRDLGEINIRWKYYVSCYNTK